MMRGAAKGSGPVREIFGNSWKRRISRGGAEIAAGEEGGFALCDPCASARKLCFIGSTIGSGIKTMVATAKRSWRPRFSLRLMLLLCVVFGLLFAYAGSYYRLSRRGMRDAEEFGLAGILYVAFYEAAATHDLTRHHYLAIFFAPANWIDQSLFGTPGPTLSITWSSAPSDFSHRGTEAQRERDGEFSSSVPLCLCVRILSVPLWP